MSETAIDRRRRGGSRAGGSRLAERVRALANEPAVARALRIVRETDDETIADMIRLSEVPAPPFGEAARAAAVRERFAELGLEELGEDEAGNVLARLPGEHDDAAPILLSAHLDTVFPAETDVTVRREADRLCGPGIADNARGLAAMLAIARSLAAAGTRPPRALVFAATVGEEGVGDLRGAQHLFREGSAWRGAAAFVSLDGSGRRRIVHRALGSRRLRAAVAGPGGHSWADWGRANPIHALALAVAEIARLRPPRQPRSTVTAGRIGGGTSVNAIPAEAWLELDLRSEGADALKALEERVRGALRDGVAQANAGRRRGTPALSLDVEVIGSRPSGETPADSELVEAAVAATEWIGETPELVASSTDANVPISLGIPAIALGAGGESGGTHTLEEWYANEGGPEGIERALLVVLAVSGQRSAVSE